MAKRRLARLLRMSDVAGLLGGHAQFHALIAIHAEHANRRPAKVREANKIEPFPTKMIFPSLLPWVKKQGHGVREGIDACDVRPLVQVAVDTSETEIRVIVAAAMLERANVFDVQRGEGRVVLMSLTVLAAVFCTLPHEGPRCGGHAALPALNFLASRRRTAMNLLALT